MKKKLSAAEKREHTRFSVISRLNLKVYVRILPYYYSEEHEVYLENISAGGLALRFTKIKPKKSFIYIQMTLPNGLCIASHAEVRYVKKINYYEYLTGVQFLDLAPELYKLIDAMCREYIECGKRINKRVKVACSTQCAAFAVCTRFEKINS